MKKNGFTLLEVTFGLTALAIAAMVMQKLIPIGESQLMQSSTESRKLSTSLRTARQMAIAGKTQVRVRFLGSQNATTGLVIETMTSGSFVPVLQESLVVSTNSDSIVFAPTGAANIALRARVGTGEKTRNVEVIAGSGMVRRDGL